jgi:hypothetical protein
MKGVNKLKQKKMKLIVICLLGLAIAAGIYTIMLNAEKKSDSKSDIGDKNTIPVEVGVALENEQMDKGTISYIFKAADLSNVGAGKIRSGDIVSIIVTYKNGTIGKIYTKQILDNVKVRNAYTTEGQVVQRNDTGTSAGMVEIIVTVEEALEIDNANLQGKLSVIKQNGTFDATEPVAVFESQ